MQKLVFASASSNWTFMSLMAASIREFGGVLSDSPIWVLHSESQQEIPEGPGKNLSSLDVETILFPQDSDQGFPFAAWVWAAAAAESSAEGNAEFLAWLGPDTMIINEPSCFLLHENKALGYRPVHHTLIGSVYDKPPDSFWELVYQKCHVAEDKIFPMNPHVDHSVLRPYFNAGCLVVKPEKGLLRSWWTCFKDVYCDPSFEKFYKRNELYSIFIHQALLSGVILSNTEREELQELPFDYNYPLHLYEDSPDDLRPHNVNDLVTVRYENFQVLRDFPFRDSLKRWLGDQLDSLLKH